MKNAIQNHKIFKNAPRKDVIIIGRDFNAEAGLPLDGERQTIGRFVTGAWNSNGELLANFAVLNDLVISNSTFQKKIPYLPGVPMTRKLEIK